MHQVTHRRLTASAGPFTLPRPSTHRYPESQQLRTHVMSHREALKKAADRLGCSVSELRTAQSLIDYKRSDTAAAVRAGVLPASCVLMHAAARGDMMAVRGLMGMGAYVDEADPGGGTPSFAAAELGQMDVLVYLVECGADLRHRTADGDTIMGSAIRNADMEMVRYVAKMAPDMVDAPNDDNCTPIMGAASTVGHTHVVRYLASLGCDLARADDEGWTALAWAVDGARISNNHDTVKLLSDIIMAGGWRPYAAACRMAYVRIRHEVSKTYAVLDEGHDDRALLHFVFGRNDVFDEAYPGYVLPDEVFEIVCKYLE